MSIYSAFVTKRFFHQIWICKTQNVQDEKTVVKTYKTSITKLIAK